MVKKSFPIFKEAASWTINPYWIGIFESCAVGKFPRGFTLSKGIIYVNKGTKCLKFEMPSKAQEVLINCKTIFESHLGLQDEQEKQQDIDDFNKHQEQNCQIQMDKEITKIKDVRKKEDKLKLIDEFVLHTGVKLNLSLFQKQKLKTAILTGLDLKIIKEMEFDESKITTIPGLILKMEKGKLNIKLEK